MFWIVFVLICLPTVCSLATKCDTMDVTTSWLNENRMSVGSITVGMEIISSQNGDTTVNVTNHLINLPDGSPFTNFVRLCQELPDSTCIGFGNPYANLNFPATNTTIWFRTDFYYYGIFSSDFIFNVTVDEGSFSMTNRSLFSPFQDTYVIEDYSLQISWDRVPRKITFQCKSFKPVPQPPPMAAQCNSFQSKTSILDAKNYYKILSTAKVDYKMYKNETIAVVNVDGLNPNEYFLDSYDFSYLPDCRTSGRPINCTFRFTYDDASKFLFGFYVTGRLQTPTESDDIKTPTFIIGRIINRNGQTLMEEGRPYTPQDNCIYFSCPLTVYDYWKPLKGSYVITSEFCCTSF